MIESMLDASGASVVVVAPHPDDESIAAGGLIQLALSNGARVTVVFLTDGDDNPWPQRALERRVWIGPRDRVRWGQRRRNEARAAVAILGVPNSSVRHLGLPDMAVTAALEADTAATVEMLCKIFRDVSPTLVVAPSPSDAHPDHSAAHVLCSLAHADCGSNAQVLSYLVHGATDSPTIECVVDSRLLEQKRRAVGAYHTQLILSGRRLMAYAARPERFVIELPVVSHALSPMVQLPWRVNRLSLALVDVILVARNRAWRIAIESTTRTQSFFDTPHCFRDSAGQLSLQLPTGILGSIPAYAKLMSRLSSPWIYDRWGWVRIDGQ